MMNNLFDPSFDDIMQSFHLTLEETRQLLPSSVVARSIKHNHQDETKSSHVDPGHLAHNLSQLHDMIHNLRNDIGDGNQNYNNKRNVDMEIQDAMTKDCHRKLSELCMLIFSHVTNHPLKQRQFQPCTNDPIFHESPPSYVWENRNQNYQPAIAYITELTLLYHTNGSEDQCIAVERIDSNVNTIASQIIHVYATYQRRVLRYRSTPSIAYLAELRRSGTLHTLYNEEEEDNVDDEEEEDHDDDYMNEKQQRKQLHAHTITIILSEASTLLQPLGAWKTSLPSISKMNDSSGSNQSQKNKSDHEQNFILFNLHKLCNDSIKMLNDEAQSLTTAIIQWLEKDHDIQGWVDRSLNYHKISNGVSLEKGVDVASLERLCNELSYSCEVLTRYTTFISSLSATPPDDSLATSPSYELSSYLDCSTIQTQISQLCGQYATLEDYFACMSLEKAKVIATPVPIITGEKLYVPSIVEDAFYISQRALERANETMSQNAISTVMHRMDEMWECPDRNSIKIIMNSTEMQMNMRKGVYEALMEGGSMLDIDEIEKSGSMFKPEEVEEGNTRFFKHNDQQSKKAQNQGGTFRFTSAFIDAITQDIEIDKDATMPSLTATSENKETNLMSLPILSSSKRNKKSKPMNAEAYLLSQICLLNGISSAASACSALSLLLNSFLTQEQDDMNECSTHCKHDTKIQTNKNLTEKLLKLSQANFCTHANNYKYLLSEKTQEVVVKWCGPTEFSDLLPLDRIQTYIEEQNYNIRDHNILLSEESKVDERIVKTFEEGRFTREVLRGGRCEDAVLMEIVKVCRTQIHMPQ